MGYCSLFLVDYPFLVDFPNTGNSQLLLRLFAPSSMRRVWFIFLVMGGIGIVLGLDAY
jgi:hypothetical protein